MKSTDAASKKLDEIRALMEKHGLDAYLVPSTDEFLSEYPPKSRRRLEALTNFTGSGGMAMILKDRAYVLTDGRYVEQIKYELDADVFEAAIARSYPETITDLVCQKDASSITMGYDPQTLSTRMLKSFQKSHFITLSPVDENLVDAIWEDRPSTQKAPVDVFPNDVAGKTPAEKTKQVAKYLQSKGVAAAILTAPDSICWLLNVRGNDIEALRVVNSRAIVHSDGAVDWFVDPAQISDVVKNHVNADVDIRFHSPEQLDAVLGELGKNLGEEASVILDADNAPALFYQKMHDAGVKISHLSDPCVDMKAAKTESEMAAIRIAHEKDGVAWVHFLHWLETEGSNGQHTEWDVGEKLEEIRRSLSVEFVCNSFPSIVGFNENGAIVHYKANERDAKRIEGPGLVLIDAGAQYKNLGTTDMTRTVPLNGYDNDEAKKDYTLVLKGHIALARARFIDKASGMQLDALARQPLLQEGKYYNHGTGHGVGCYMDVHEAGASMSSARNSKVGVGSFFSNEPGFYKAGSHGIRIENLVHAFKIGVCDGVDADLCALETVSLAPIDTRMVLPEMMSTEEIEWLNQYHAKVRKELSPHLSTPELGWLENATAPL